MEINIKKSGFTGPALWPLTIYGHPIPRTMSYKYLGLPIIKDGIDWLSFVTDCTTKSNNILKYMQVKGNNWPPITKLALFKSNIRSLWEYAAPLMAIALTEIELDLLEQVQQDSLAWVVGTSKFKGTSLKRLIRSLTGIESINDRLETLLIKFGVHITKCTQSNRF
ncbi:hypothetical protein AYI70_g7141 [Smittium culicis]|uniref:Uncharacterized protein n=1 Tax=Smittium culicis TaxID=133412 RepID=A0A1R1XLV3_9FUNG|nr:hypothetical protein AYI70_g7141 [Smittium culicis]